MLPDEGRCVLPPAEPDCDLLRLGRGLGPPTDEPGRDGWRRGDGDGFDGISPNGSSSSRPENAFTASLGAWGRTTAPLPPFLLFIFDAMSALLDSSLSGYYLLHAPHAASGQSLENSNHILEFDNPSMLFRMNTLLNTSCLLSTSAYPLLVNRYVHLIVCPLRGGSAERGAGRGREAFRICNGKRSPPSVRRLHIVPVYGTVSGGVLILDAELLHLIGGDEVGNHHRRLRRVGGIGNLRLKR